MDKTLVRDVMGTSPLVVGPYMTVHRLAETFVEHGADGAIVIDDHGEVVGVVTSMDLVYQEKKVHLPTMLQFMELVVPLGVADAKEELERMTATTVEELMSEDPVTVRADVTLAEAATIMVDQHISLLPVVDEGGALVGSLTRMGLVRWMAAGKPSSRVYKD